MSGTNNTAAAAGGDLLDHMWLLRRETLKSIVLALAFLLALSIHWAVTDSLRQTLVTARSPWLLRATYPLVVILALWLARTLSLLPN